MKNKLELVKVFVSQLPLKLITPRDLPVCFQNLQNLISVFLLIIVRRKIFFCLFKRTISIIFFEIYILPLINLTRTFLKTKET